jgi:hypothetical protein
MSKLKLHQIYSHNNSYKSHQSCRHKNRHQQITKQIVVTLTLGSQLRQGLVKAWVESET